MRQQNKCGKNRNFSSQICGLIFRNKHICPMIIVAILSGNQFLHRPAKVRISEDNTKLFYLFYPRIIAAPYPRISHPNFPPEFPRSLFTTVRSLLTTVSGLLTAVSGSLTEIPHAGIFLTDPVIISQNVTFADVTFPRARACI